MGLLWGSLSDNLGSPVGVIRGHFMGTLKFNLRLLLHTPLVVYDIYLVPCTNSVMLVLASFEKQEAIEYEYFPLVEVWSESGVRENTSNCLLH